MTKIRARGSLGASAAPEALSGQRWTLLLVLFLVSFCSLTSNALAAQTRAYTGASFGRDGLSGAVPFELPESVASAPGINLVYVFDAAEGGKIFRFGLTGEPDSFSSTGTNVVEGVGSAGAGESQIAVAPSGALGGTQGDIYAAHYGAPVSVYGASGEKLGELGGSTSCGVAVDPNGNLYIAEYPEKIRKFTPVGNPPTEADLSGESVASFPGICNLAADGLGNVYAAAYSGETIFKLEGVADPTPVEITPGGQTIAVDGSNGLLVDRGNKVLLFDAAGKSAGAFAGGRLTGSLGLSIGGADNAFVANGATRKVEIYGPQEEAKPEILSETASSVTASDATVKALINPNGASTTAYVEFGLTSAYGSKTAETALGSGEEPKSVAASLTGLSPQTTYHYRWIAKSGELTVSGEDRTFTTFAVSQSGEVCSNQNFRVGAGGLLPDCRAYEMVSPIDKNGAGIKAALQGFNFRAQTVQASADGNRLAYSTYRAFGEVVSAPYAVQYLAQRGSGSWASTSLSPRKDGDGPEGEVAPIDLEPEYRDFSSDLSYGWLENREADVLAPGAIPGLLNVYEHNNLAGGFRAITNSTPLKAPYAPNEVGEVRYEGHSADNSHVLFSSEIPQTANSDLTARRELYDSVGGSVSLVSVLPNGTVANEAFLGSPTSTPNWPRIGFLSVANAVSADGSTIYWSNNEVGAEGLYVRVNGTETRLVSAGEAFFRTATPNGSKMLYEVGPEYGENGLYIYDLAAGTSSKVAGKVQGVLGASTDLSRVYFVSGENLAQGGEEGALNLYLADGNTFTFVTKLTSTDVFSNAQQTDVSRFPSRRNSRVSDDGKTLAFMSAAPLLPGFDNTDISSGKPDSEVYIYRATEGKLLCVSCNRAGRLPEGQRARFPYIANEELTFAPELWTAAWLNTSESSFHSPRDLSANGQRLFFNSIDSLVPRDTNGQQDVYEWEANGEGGCSEAAGCVYLISSGQSPDKSEFVDADTAGNTVFFETTASLVAGDPGFNDIYAARVNGGMAAAPVPTVECAGEVCQGPSPPAPATQSVGTSTFVGPAHHKKGKHKKAHRKHPKHRHKNKGQTGKSKHRQNDRGHSRTKVPGGEAK